MIRLAKRLSQQQVCSRREGERLIKAGKVFVNGARIKPENGCALVSESDKIFVEGLGAVGYKAKEPKVWLCHKIRRELVTRNDPGGRRTIFERLERMGAPNNLFSVGRLDYDSEGLILFTNRGDLSRILELPSTGLVRKYRVRAWSRDGKINYRGLNWLAREQGILVGQDNFQSIGSKVLKKSDSKDCENWLDVTVKEGKYREVRRALGMIGMNVTRLIRTQYGPFTLGKLSKGDLLEVRRIPKNLLDKLDG